jgi:hypothetical protein
MHELAGEGVGEPTLVASRARTYRHEKNIRISGRFIRVGEQGLRQNNRAENSHQST